jgi:hypothetical protein
MARETVEIWPQTNTNQVFMVAGNEATLIPAGGRGGFTQSQLITALIRTGAIDRRPGVPGSQPFPESNDAIKALEILFRRDHPA